MTESKICTCPSGEGSLRWPCPKHPAVEQVGGDERAALQELIRVRDWVKNRRGQPEKLKNTGQTYIMIEKCETLDMLEWAIERTRAALAQPSPKCATCGGTGMVDDGEITCSEGGIPYENGPVKCVKDCPDCKAQPSPPPHPAPELDFSRPLETENGDPVKWICADVIEYKSARVCVAKDTGLVYSSPYIGLKIRNVMPEQAEAERPEGPTEDELEAAGLGYPLHKEEAVKLWYSGLRSEVITVLEAWEAIGHDTGINPDKEELLDSLRYMLEKCEAHDAALARVAELTATRNRYGVDAHYFNKNLQRILRDFESFTPDELARSLIILAKVADEKVVAQAQHSAGYAEARQCVNCRHIGINDAADYAACHDCRWTGPEPDEDKCPGCAGENCMAAACPECGGRYELVAEANIATPVAQAQHSVPEGYALIPVRETEAMHDAVMALLYKGVARTDTQKLLDAYIAAAPGKEGV